jgi:RNA polymerase sigma factor (sigma-70 family)
MPVGGSGAPSELTGALPARIAGEQCVFRRSATVDSVRLTRGCCSITVGRTMSTSRVEPTRDGELQDLLIAARAGESEATGRLLELHRDYLLLIANEELTRHGDRSISPSDIVQWTNLEVWRDFARFEGSTIAEFRGWLRRSLLNNLADSRRRVHRTSEEICADTPATDPSPSHQVAGDDAREQLRASLDCLPHLERQVIELRYFHGRSYAEIAAEIGRTPEATRKLWARAVARLQTKLKYAGIER